MEKDIRKIEAMTGAYIDYGDWSKYLRLDDVKIPFGLVQYLIEKQDTPDMKRLSAMAKEHKERWVHKALDAVEQTEAVIQELESKLAVKETKTNRKKLESKLRVLEKQKAKVYEVVEGNVSARIYPLEMAPLIIQKQGNKSIILARYQVSKEYESFNARRDTILRQANENESPRKTQAWKPLFGHTHGVFFFKRFYEWVEENRRSKLIYFTPNNSEYMNAACLYKSFDDQHLTSFAIITDDPPKEVLAAGHDRCPVLLKDDLVDPWLSPHKMSTYELDGILEDKFETTFQPHHG